MANFVCIFYLPDGEVWAKYLQDRLNSEQYDISAVTKHYREVSTAKDTQTKLNIMLITPDLIETDNLDLRVDYGGATCVAVLAGVDHESWILAKTVLRLDNELDWFIYELEADADSVRDLMVFLVSLYESIGRQSPRLSWPERESLSSDTDNETGKGVVQIGTRYNKVEGTGVKETVEDDARPESVGSIYKELPAPRPVHAISHVFEKDDQIYLVLEGINNGVVEVKFRESENPVTATQVSDKATMYSFRHERSMGLTFDVMLDTIVIGQGDLTREMRPDYDLYDIPSLRDSLLSSSSGVSSRVSELSTGSLSPRQRAPPPPSAHRSGQSNSSYANEQGRALAAEPSSTSSTRSVSMRSSNTSSIASLSKLDQLNKLLSDVIDPISILCQSLEINDDVVRLDEKLSQMMVSTDALAVISCQSVLDSISEPRDSIWPTLLHFGANFGMRRLCMSLVNNKVTRSASAVKNVDNCYPHDIARQQGHIELATTLKQVSDDVLNKTEDRASLVSLGSLEYQYPPPVPARAPSMKGASSEEEGTPKGILKRQSQSSLTSEDGYDSVTDLRRSRQRGDGDSVSISSTDSLRVTFGPRGSEMDNDKTPVPRMDDPLDTEIQGRAGIRTSNPIAISKPKPHDEDIAEAHRKDIADYLGMPQLSSSVPSANHMHHYMKEKEESHGFLDHFRRKKTPPKSTFYPGEGDERVSYQRDSHSERKTKVYRHKKGHHDDKDSSSDQDQEQFRSRLQTYPLPGQIMRRPNVKKLKEKHAAAVNEIVWSATEAGTNPRRVSKDDSDLPDVSLRHRKSHNSKEKKDKKELHSSKKKEHAKDHHKHRITWIIQQASKRTSARFHIAQNDQHASAPALPPRQPTVKNLGKF